MTDTQCEEALMLLSSINELLTKVAKPPVMYAPGDGANIRVGLSGAQMTTPDSVEAVDYLLRQRNDRIDYLQNIIKEKDQIIERYVEEVKRLADDNIRLREELAKCRDSSA